ncbi:uncharacterized protein LOC131496945 [Neofelis nebulosa]|uniref:uncharacterized protein LOC131496945 n=1 Tax=Neofelis nebulosa TaxID=61452 RepID=UPI00272C83CA|nr:uncharacterized protein LOC131496945 [Neofelis nebulosa]
MGSEQEIKDDSNIPNKYKDGVSTTRWKKLQPQHRLKQSASHLILGPRHPETLLGAKFLDTFGPRRPPAPPAIPRAPRCAPTPAVDLRPGKARRGLEAGKRSPRRSSCQRRRGCRLSPLSAAAAAAAAAAVVVAVAVAAVAAAAAAAAAAGASLRLARGTARRRTHFLLAVRQTSGISPLSSKTKMVQLDHTCGTVRLLEMTTSLRMQCYFCQQIFFLGNNCPVIVVTSMLCSCFASLDK